MVKEKSPKTKGVKTKIMKTKAKENDVQFELILTITNRGYSDFVVEAARNAGASGGTIVNGRGTGVHEKESILGVSIQPEKEMVLTLVKKEEKCKIMKAIVDGANLNKEGKGICFSLPVEDVAGINHMLNENEAVATEEEQHPEHAQELKTAQSVEQKRKESAAKSQSENKKDKKKKD